MYDSHSWRKDCTSYVIRSALETLEQSPDDVAAARQDALYLKEGSLNEPFSI